MVDFDQAKRIFLFVYCVIPCQYDTSLNETMQYRGKYMKHIQTTINDEDFLRLKGLCILTNLSLKQTIRIAILQYLNYNSILINSNKEGAVENGS